MIKVLRGKLKERGLNKLMKTFDKMRFISVLIAPLLVVMMSTPTITMAATQPTVNLGTTSTFAVLAHETITNTGSTVISGSAGGNVDGKVGGDVGLYPGTIFTGKALATISGATHLTDAVAQKAMADLLIAYNDAAGRSNVTRISTELGGKTLKPGTYDSADGTFEITGKLTLDAQGDPNAVFIFKTASTLKTASASSVNLVNGARFCRTFWQVGSSATLGTNSEFVGHIFAKVSITATTGAKVQGQLLALTGAVTLDTNTITNGYCDTTTAVTGDKVVNTTVVGGQLPKTSTHLYELILIGATLTIIGMIGWMNRKRFE